MASKGNIGARRQVAREELMQIIEELSIELNVQLDVPTMEEQHLATHDPLITQLHSAQIDLAIGNLMKAMHEQIKSSKKK
jgi:hypothetical protein